MSDRIQALFLDLDDTLLDGSLYPGAVMRACAKIAENQGSLLADDLLQANGVAFAAYWAEVAESWTLGGTTGEALTLEVWRRALAACECRDEELVRRAQEVHAGYTRE